MSGLGGIVLKKLRHSVVFILLVACVSICFGADPMFDLGVFYKGDKSRHHVDSVAQFGLLTGADYLDGCDFDLKGVVTMVDPDRDLMVLQDATGAVALNFPLRHSALRVGQSVSLAGNNCSPYFVRHPNYPFRPSGREVLDAFEAPAGCGEYYLARVRGYLRPPATGEYSFWIASDNSSELWLSADHTPSRARKIASLSRFEWVAPREWSHFPSQHSESIWLQAGRTYYIEALHEQTTVGENLAVAWQGPGLERSVIDGRYLTPCSDGSTDVATNGILREFWTNFIAGDLVEVGGARPFRSMLSVETVDVRRLGPGQLPKPDSIVIGRPWREENNYRWVAAEGEVKFVGAEASTVWLWLASETAQIQVRSPRLDSEFLQRLRNARVRVEGVCEGVYDKCESLVPGIIWISGDSGIHVIEEAKTNVQKAVIEPAGAASTINVAPTRQGFYSTRGVVTFNDRVAGEDYLVVQEEESAKLICGGETSFFQKRLKVGEWVELGGALRPGKDLPVLAPLVITELGQHSMPVPTEEPLAFPTSANRAGQWSEVTGVAHAVNSNGMLSVVSKDGPVYFWIGQMPTNELARFVDARIRVQGVLWPNLPDAPLLLVPSRNYVDVEEPVRDEPFQMSRRLISELALGATECAVAHRVKVAGQITYRDAGSFILQDASGGIRVRPSNRFDAMIGDVVEALGFVTVSGSGRTLTDALVRPAKSAQGIQPRTLDVNEGLWTRKEATLVVAKATLLGRKINDNCEVFELQEQQRVFNL